MFGAPAKPRGLLLSLSLIHRCQFFADSGDRGVHHYLHPVTYAATHRYLHRYLHYVILPPLPLFLRLPLNVMVTVTASTGSFLSFPFFPGLLHWKEKRLRACRTLCSLHRRPSSFSSFTLVLSPLKSTVNHGKTTQAANVTEPVGKPVQGCFYVAE